MAGTLGRVDYLSTMSDCGCAPTETTTQGQRNVLRIALALNAIMFVAEVAAGTAARSNGLIADGLDMLSDALVYAVALAAIERGDRFRATAARLSGVMLMALGIGVLADAVRRLFAGGSPEGLWMIAVSLVALAVNATVLRLLAKSRHEGVHMRAAWIFTRADVLANTAVILSGGAVLFTGIRYFDLATGTLIGLYVVREALEILKETRDGGR